MPRGAGATGGPRRAAWGQTSLAAVHQRLRRRLKAVGEEAALTKLDVLHKGYFLYLCWGKVTLKTSAVWKQIFFFFVNGVQFFVFFFFNLLNHKE